MDKSELLDHQMRSVGSRFSRARALIYSLLALCLGACGVTGPLKPVEPWKAVPIEARADTRRCVDSFRLNAVRRRPQSRPLEELSQVAQLGNTADIRAIALSSDGRALVSGDTDGAIVVRDLASGTHLRSIYASAEVRALAAVPSKSLVFAATRDCQISLWDIRTGSLLANVDQVEGVIDHLVFVKSTGESHVIAAATQVELTAWQVGQQSARLLFRLPIDRIEGVSASADGTRIAVAAHDSVIRLVDMNALTVTQIPIKPGLSRSDVSFEGRDALRVIDGDGEVSTIGLVDRSRRVTCRISDRVEFVHGSTGVVPVGVWRQTSAVRRQLASAFTSGVQRRVIFWDLERCSRLLEANWGDAGYGYIPPNPVALSLDGTEAMYADGRSIVVVNASTGTRRVVLSGQSEALDFVRATADGTLVALEGRSRALLLDWTNSEVFVRPIERPLIESLPKDSRVPRNSTAMTVDKDGARILLTVRAAFAPAPKADGNGRSRISLTSYDPARRAEREVCPGLFDQDGELGSLLVSSNGKTAALFMLQAAGIHSWRHWTSVYDLGTCQFLRRVDLSPKQGNWGHVSANNHALLSPDGTLLVAAWSGHRRPHLHLLRPPNSSCSSADAIALEATAETVPNVSGEPVYGVRSLAFSADGGYIMAGHDSGDANIWDLEPVAATLCRWPKALKARWHLAGIHSAVRAVTFDPRTVTAAVGDESGVLRVIGLEPTLERQHTLRFSAPIRGAHFLDDRYMLVATADGMATVVDRTKLGAADTTTAIEARDTDPLRADLSVPTPASPTASPPGSRLLSVVATSDHGWVATTPEGRFDANDIEGVSGLRWVMSDDPMRALPIELFMREYYEPRLIERLKACGSSQSTSDDSGACSQEFGRVRRLVDANRAQPRVVGIAVTPEVDNDRLVKVEVTVEATDQSLGAASTRVWRSGAYDLRLFRDGQLVGQVPDAMDPEPLRSEQLDEELAAWRMRSALVKELGTKTVTLRNIRIPDRSDQASFEFSAYAFNTDRIKGTTARATYTPRQVAGSTVRRRAYVVAVGVSAFTDPAWDLRYADNDARRMIEVLAPRLSALARYDEIIAVPLLASWTDEAGARKVTAAAATKGNIKRVLDVLAGRTQAPAVDAGIPNQSRLDRAAPDDLVVIAFSSHGYVDRSGNFFVFPFDIGEKARADSSTTRRAISSAELSAWLKDVDAGDLVVIIDACHSAAGVAIPGFKPGPMGSRGLGQLAYDKGMRVLASTRADDLAWESDDKEQGLLSFALVHDGLELGRADYRPPDGVIGVGEWLAYAAWRVPDLYREGLARGTAARLPPMRIFDPGSRRARPFEVGGVKVDPAGQRPQVFDFRRRPDLPIFRAATAAPQEGPK